MLPKNILYRTFFIRAAEYGTAFTLDVNGEQYLITARHLLPEAGDSIELSILRNKQWVSMAAKIVGRGRGEVDITVLLLPARLTPMQFQVTASMGELFVGQDVFFVGYPYKMWADYGDLTDGLPGPFLKKGTLSSMTLVHPKLMYVDAINNEGFSGGPLYFFRDGNIQELRIAGVVSKYKTQHEPVLNSVGKATTMNVPYNTGFMVAYDIKHALDLISNSRGD